MRGVAVVPLGAGSTPCSWDDDEPFARLLPCVSMPPSVSGVFLLFPLFFCLAANSTESSAMPHYPRPPCHQWIPARACVRGGML